MVALGKILFGAHQMTLRLLVIMEYTEIGGNVM